MKQQEQKGEDYLRKHPPVKEPIYRYDYNLPGGRKRDYFWSTSRFRCPCGCNHIFTYREMWEGLALAGFSIRECCNALNYSTVRVRQAVLYFGLELKFEGTAVHNTWRRLALWAGYNSPYEMFYHLKIQKKHNLPKIALMLGFDISDAKERSLLRGALKEFTNPKSEAVQEAWAEINSRPGKHRRIVQGWDKAHVVIGKNKRKIAAAAQQEEEEEE